MPSGKVHDKLTVITAAVAIPVWWVAAPVKDFAALAITLGSYLFSGFWLSDDLDTNSVAYKRWGIFRWLWWPYRQCVPHRSWVSHGPGIGPLLRVAYFLVMLWVFARCLIWLLIKAGVAVNRDTVINSSVQGLFAWSLDHPSWILCGVIGLVLGGVTHSLADIVVSWTKKVW